ncbi:hypothetical protein ACSYGO_27885 [Streptomyces krungchingensis]
MPPKTAGPPGFAAPSTRYLVSAERAVTSVHSSGPNTFVAAPAAVPPTRQTVAPGSRTRVRSACTAEETEAEGVSRTAPCFLPARAGAVSAYDRLSAAAQP